MWQCLKSRRTTVGQCKRLRMKYAMIKKVIGGKLPRCDQPKWSVKTILIADQPKLWMNQCHDQKRTPSELNAKLNLVTKPWYKIHSGQTNFEIQISEEAFVFGAWHLNQKGCQDRSSPVVQRRYQCKYAQIALTSYRGYIVGARSKPFPRNLFKSAQDRWERRLLAIVFSAQNLK